MMLSPKIWILSTVAGSVLGALVGGLMMYIAWQHNPQGEFHDIDGVHWLSWVGVGLSWFVAVLVVVTVVVGVMWFLGKWIVRHATQSGANHSASGDGPPEDVR